MAPTIHASAVLVGARAVLIRGASGAGKSRLALRLLQAADSGALPFARLVADDRAYIEAVHGRLVVRPAAVLAGRIEVRGLGIRRVPHEPLAVVGTVIDLTDSPAERLPDPAATRVEVEGVSLPRLAVAGAPDPLPAVLAYLRTEAAPD